jgi:hypothetical protein
MRDAIAAAHDLSDAVRLFRASWRPLNLKEQILDDKGSTRYLAVVLPPRQRLTAAVAALRLDQNHDLAKAADLLSRAAGKFAAEAASKIDAFEQADNAYIQELEAFQAVATRSCGTTWPGHEG